MVMPPGPSQYCDYFSSGGYLGYSWPAGEGAPSAFPCAPSFYSSGDGGSDYFCVLQNGTDFVNIPEGAAAECGNLSGGVIGYSWAIGG
jgi:hypothetical protein